MTTKKRTAASETVKELVAGDRDLMKALMKEALQEVLEAEMSQALCVETHEGWLEDSRYLNMSLLTEHKKELLRKAA